MNRLTELGIKYGTDKSTYHTFTEFYYQYFLRYKNPTVLEIGLYNGASIKMMEEFFGAPTIIGADIEPKTQYDNEHIKTVVADQSNPVQLLRVLDYAKEFDIIVDDGSHIISHQLTTLATLFPYVKSGGIYILEDLHTSFCNSYVGYQCDITAYDVVYRLKKNLEVKSKDISVEQMKYIVSNISNIEIYQSDKKSVTESVTCTIVKR
jgi:hypothetical protein